jgi:Fe-S-cluster containining protein
VSRRADKKRNARARRDAEGRLHLELHRDSNTGAEYVTLEQPVFGQDWQNQIAAGAANTAHEALAGEATLARAVELARNAMSATSRLAEGLLSQAPEGSVACKAGCDHCCYQVVGVTPPEALAILEHLTQTRSEAELTELQSRVAELYERGRGKTSSERFSPDHPCAFLDVSTGRCTIYEARPLSCRGMNSLDAGECSTRLREPSARARFLAGGLGSRSYLEPIRAFHAISAGIQLALSELYRLDMHPLELTAVMHALLSEPEPARARWLAGQAAFSAAYSSELDADPAMRAVSGVLAQSPKLNRPR